MPRHDDQYDRSGKSTGRNRSHGRRHDRDRDRDRDRRRSRSPKRQRLGSCLDDDDAAADGKSRHERRAARSTSPHHRDSRQRSPPPSSLRKKRGDGDEGEGDKQTAPLGMLPAEDEEDKAGTQEPQLPFGARRLTRGDLRRFEPVLAHYLALQKQRCMDDMGDREVRGRWKRFVGRWNRGELAEGWYDPDMFGRIVAEAESYLAEAEGGGKRDGAAAVAAEDDEDDDDDESEGDGDGGRKKKRKQGEEDEDEDDDDDDYGPTLPSRQGRRRQQAKKGVAMPSRDDLAARDEMGAEERQAGREAHRADRRAERRLQRERMEELAGPRADPGTWERRQEKRREAGERMMRNGSPVAVEEANDRELMGGGDSVAELKFRRDQERRFKTAREVRREEMARARMVEIEEKRRKWDERERGTMSMLQEIAKQRFG